jgi:hypothetical protein
LDLARYPTWKITACDTHTHTHTHTHTEAPEAMLLDLQVPKNPGASLKSCTYMIKRPDNQREKPLLLCPTHIA